MNDKTNKLTNPTYVKFDSVTLKYGRESSVLCNCKFSLPRSKDRPQRYALIGESGSGKTTIVKLILGNLVPQSGRILIDGRKLCYDEISLRNHRASIGYISQNLNGMISYLNILDNVKRPAVLEGIDSDEANELARNALQSVGLDNLWRKTPDQLSGGELQRALIAKMIVRRPRFMICDEPTSALDRPNSKRVVDAILRTNLPILVVTHDPALFAPHMDGLFLLAERGKLYDVTKLKNNTIWNRFVSTQDLLDEVRRLQSSKSQQSSRTEQKVAVTSDSNNSTCQYVAPIKQSQDVDIVDYPRIGFGRSPL